jgi:hypothetical protein
MEVDVQSMTIEELKRFLATLLQDGTGASIGALREIAQRSPAKTSATISAIGARLLEGGMADGEVQLIMAELRNATSLQLGRDLN